MEAINEVIALLANLGIEESADGLLLIAGSVRKGWFKIPGVQDGDRTLEEQLEALRPALTEASGKTVFDIGTAEGLLGIEFAKAGAKSVLGVDLLEDHIAVAKKMAKGMPNVTFRTLNLNHVTPEEATTKYDIVLALGVLHKCQDPEPRVRWAVQSCSGLFLFRSKGGETGGVVRSKHFKRRWCSAWDILKLAGFRLEKTVKGANGEKVEYWRKA